MAVLMILDAASRAKGLSLLRSHWTPTTVAEKGHCHFTTNLRWEQRLQMHDTLNPPHRLRTGRFRRIQAAARESLVEYFQ